MKKILRWLIGFVSDKGEASSKRLVGVMCASFLCGAMLKDYNPSDSLVFAVSGLAFASLGLTSAEKIFKKSSSLTEETKSE
jgi:hypothetical protein